MAEHQQIQEATRLSSRLIYEVVRRDGEEELERPAKSLIWSGIAAGILISFSVIGEAIFRTYLPDTDWRFLIENLGYSFGFLLVILGRMQLFTENTITTILPLAAERSRTCLLAVLRLWVIVLTANIVGALIAAVFMSHSGVFDATIMPALISLSEHATGFAPWQAFLKAIPAGILIAAIVWMMPGQTGNDVVLVIAFTWLIAAGDFTHIIAGSVEMWMLLVDGSLGVGAALFSFFLPVLLGNVVGGTAVFAFLAYGQVSSEIDAASERQA